MTDQFLPLEKSNLLHKIRWTIVFFIVMLSLSGLTAAPAETLLSWLMPYKSILPQSLANTLTEAYEALHETNIKYPFLAYGYDWLAFGHLVIAGAFIGTWRDPVRNIWVIEWAMWACVAVIPWAMIWGPVRGLPFFWLLIDCSFGVFGIIPLWLVWRWIRQLGENT
jgi:hypothetical protein